MRKYRLIEPAFLTAAACLIAMPASATRDLSAASSRPEFSARSSEVHARVTAAHSQGAKSTSVSSNTKPTGWLMVVAGFGLLGAATRRGTMEPLQEQSFL